MLRVRLGVFLVVPLLPWTAFGTPTGGIRIDAINLRGVATSLLKTLDVQASESCTKYGHVHWSYYTNVTEATRQAQVEAKLRYAQEKRDSWETVQAFGNHWNTLPDAYVRRQFQLLSTLGTAALTKDDLKQFTSVQSELLSIYSSAKVCSYASPCRCDLSLSPELKGILRTSRDYEELTHVWTSWRNASGRKMRNLYQDYVRLANKAASLNGFDNMAELWLTVFNETGTFLEDLAENYRQLSPLYQQLHAYVRRKLREVYGEEHVTAKGPIPAHLLGDMWAQWWDNIYQLVEPYPNKESVDVTGEMVKQGYTPRKMFQLADDFFASLNLSRVPSSFWQKSIIEKPEDREIVCHASAWDFCDKKDFRIKMCTKVVMPDLATVHHEMGHVQYYMQYKDLPLVFRSGANEGFHEAIGDVIGMSVSSPKHLKSIGLLKASQEDKEIEINFLLNMALNKVGFLPFAYLVDLWRWDVFRGHIPESDWNCAWWKLRSELQGVSPPVLRTEDDFDPGAKYHVAADVSYVRYFVANVLQFQFHKALCLKAGEYDPLDPTKPLHKCDIYQSTEAGNALGDMMRLGSSRPWPEALEALTGGRKMDASAMREYFRPLEEWLKQNNIHHGEHVGWVSDGEYCQKTAAASRVHTCSCGEDGSSPA